MALRGEAKKDYNKAYYEANREKIKASVKLYADANREKIKQRSKEYLEDVKKDPERKARVKASKDRYREANREKAKVYNRVRYNTIKTQIEFKEKAKAWSSNYAKANPESRCALEGKRRSSKLQRTPEWLTSSDLVNIKGFYAMSIRISKCLGIVHHVDHIVPLRGKTVSGLHVPWNLQVLPAKLNISKGNKL